MSNLISPNFEASKLDSPTIENLVDVFEDRMKFWFLAPAQKLTKTFDDLPASLCLQMTYFEGIWSFITGEDSNGRSAEFFRNGFVTVFRGHGPSDELLGRVANVLYRDARCGFFHDGMFRDRIYFGNRGLALEITLPKVDGVLQLDGEIESIIIDPRRFLATINKHFTDFVANARDSKNEDVRNKFERTYNRRQGKCRAIGIPEIDISTDAGS